MQEIYVVMHANYSDWHINGFFTNKDDAEKWATTKGDCEIVQMVQCLDGKVDYSNVSLKYEHEIVFDHKDNTWKMRNEPDRYTTYINKYFRSNFIRAEHYMYNKWVAIRVNTESRDRSNAEKIAQDLLYQYLESCYGVPNNKATDAFNMMLSEEERNRLELQKQEKLRKKELAELERLKKKYESQ
jgi:hypothetical protein